MAIFLKLFYLSMVRVPSGSCSRYRHEEADRLDVDMEEAIGRHLVEVTL